MNLTDLQTFAMVADRGTITAAAAALGVPKSTVSRRVARLEQALGVALLARSSSAVALTEPGRRLHARAADALRALAEASDALADPADPPVGLLRVRAPPDLGTTRALTTLFTAYRRAFPDVRVEVSLGDGPGDLVASGYDLALRVLAPRSTGYEDGLTMRLLGALPAGLYASPDHLGRHGVPATPDDLAAHPWITHPAWGGPPLTLHRAPRDRAVVHPEPALTTNHLDHLLALLLDHGGVGAIPTALADPWVRLGVLAPVLPGWSPPGGRLGAVWPTTRHLAPRVRAFVDLAVTRLAADR